MLCSGEISSGYKAAASVSRSLCNVASLRQGLWDRLFFFAPDSSGLPASQRTSKGRKTHPQLEQNILVKKKTDLPNLAFAFTSFSYA